MPEMPPPLTVGEVLRIMKEQYPKEVNPPLGALDALIEAQVHEGKVPENQKEELT